MELKRCKNGHAYDPSITPECPECAAMEGHTVPLVGADMGAGLDWGVPPVMADPPFGATGVTNPVNGDPWGGNGGWISTEEIGNTVPLHQGETQAVNPEPVAWASQDYYKEAETFNHGGGVTMPVGYKQEMGAVRPVTGWLVCVQGAEKGKDFRLHADMNYIGRSRTNDVVLASDPTVSRERHAMIAYDTRGKMFFFAPVGGSSLVRQNGKPVLSTVELKRGDRIEIGEGTYIFVPLCGEDFEW